MFRYPESPSLTAETAVLTEAARALLDTAVRVWVSGIIARDPLDTPLQMQPFANWTRSNLRYDLGVGDIPPPGYKGTAYESIGLTYPISIYADDPDSHMI